MCKRRSAHDHPDPGEYRRDDQQSRAHLAPNAPGDRPASRHWRNLPKRWRCRLRRCVRCWRSLGRRSTSEGNRPASARRRNSFPRKIHSTVASWPATRLIVRRQSASARPPLRSISISAPSRLCRAFRSRVSSVRPSAFLMLSIRVSVIKHPHCEPQDRVIRPDNRGNWARARRLALCILSHTCIERTSCRTGTCAVQRRIAGRSPESPQRGRKHRSG